MESESCQKPRIVELLHDLDQTSLCLRSVQSVTEGLSLRARANRVALGLWLLVMER